MEHCPGIRNTGEVHPIEAEKGAASGQEEPSDSEGFSKHSASQSRSDINIFASLTTVA